MEESIEGAGSKTWKIYFKSVAVLRGREGARISQIIERMKCKDSEDDYTRIGNFMISREKLRLKHKDKNAIVMGIRDTPQKLLHLLYEKIPSTKTSPKKQFSQRRSGQSNFAANKKSVQQNGSHNSGRSGKRQANQPTRGRNEKPKVSCNLHFNLFKNS